MVLWRTGKARNAQKSSQLDKPEKNLKKVEKGLDKVGKTWYNKSMEDGNPENQLNLEK